jgi:hypothetical protein
MKSNLVFTASFFVAILIAGLFMGGRRRGNPLAA